MKKKTCFVISPIGKDGSETRKKMDLAYNHIIRPVVEEAGYEPIRADHIKESGLITRQIVDRLLNSDLVIADLTNENPNVYYELAIRHVADKPVIHMISPIDAYIPFDISIMRTIKYDLDIESGLVARTTLREMVGLIDETVSTNPIKEVINLQIIKDRLESEKQITSSRSMDNLLLETIINVKESLDSLRNEFVTLKNNNAPKKDSPEFPMKAKVHYDSSIIERDLNFYNSQVSYLSNELDSMKKAGKAKIDIDALEMELGRMKRLRMDARDNLLEARKLETYDLVDSHAHHTEKGN